MCIRDSRSAGESGQLYGSVNARDIVEAVTEAGFTVTREQVIADRPTKVLGFHEFRIRLHPEVETTVIANVARSEEEAEIQTKLGRAMVGEDEDKQQVVNAEEAAPGAAGFMGLEAVEDASKEGNHSPEDASADSREEDKNEEKSD